MMSCNLGKFLGSLGVRVWVRSACLPLSFCSARIYAAVSSQQTICLESGHPN